MNPRKQNHGLIFHSYEGCPVNIDGPILVPYDRYLWLFLDAMAAHPNEDGNEIDTKLAKMTINGTSATFRYPEDVAANIKIVLAGLSHVYASSPLHIVNRIDWTPSTTKLIEEDKSKPIFRAHGTPISGVHLCPMKRRNPHDPRELQWLEAFLKVITWLEDNSDMLGTCCVIPHIHQNVPSDGCTFRANTTLLPIHRCHTGFTKYHRSPDHIQD